MELPNASFRLHHDPVAGKGALRDDWRDLLDNLRRYTCAAYYSFSHKQRRHLEAADSWNEYHAAAQVRSVFTAPGDWQSDSDAQLYDQVNLADKLGRLQGALKQNTLQRAVQLLRTELTRDVAGICNPDLHAQNFRSAEHLVRDYINTISKILDCVTNACADAQGSLNKRDVLKQLEHTRESYGRNALLLSGGGTLGMTHIGVVKALSETGVLPRIICGSSSGSIVASVLGNTTDEELPQMLEDFCQGDLAVFVGHHERNSVAARAEHLLKHGSWFSSDSLRGVMIDLLGAKTTFRDAYYRTGRILNITVSSGDRFQSRQILNYKTAGDVVIWSAVVASCAVPFFFNAQQLLCKDTRSNHLTLWDPDTSYIDGSVEGDIPTDKLSELFNVNHTIVSQTNPHVVPFLSASPWSVWPQHPWSKAATGFTKAEASHLLGLLTGLPRLEIIMMKLGLLVSQDYTGDATVFPVNPIDKLWSILRTPTVDFMQEAYQKGRLATYPHLESIKTRMKIEMSIEDAIRKLKEHVSFSRSAHNLRLLQIEENAKSIHASGGRRRAHKSTRKPGREDALRLADLRWKPRSADFMLNAGDSAAKHSIQDSQSFNSGTKRGSVSFEFPLDDESSTEDDIINEPPEPPPYSSILSLPSKSDSELFLAQSMPNTPAAEKKAYFDSPRSTSPVGMPATLAMTPITPRSSSPELTFRSPSRNRSASTRRPASRTSSPYSFRRVRYSTGPRTVDLQLPRKRRQRRYTTGMSGLPEPEGWY